MSAVLASLCPAPLLCQHWRSAGRCSARQLPALLGTRSGPAATASAPLVSSRSPLRPLSWALKGRLLLHLGGLVPGCCTSGACTESVTAGAGGCANSRSRESEDLVPEKSNCPAAGAGLGAKTITESHGITHQTITESRNHTSPWNHRRKGQKVRGGARETQRGVLHQFDRV